MVLTVLYVVMLLETILFDNHRMFGQVMQVLITQDRTID